MSQIENNNHGKTRSLTGRASLRVDLTPMVDLGFLLISFFMLTTTLSQHSVANLIMPKDSEIETPVGELATLTLIPVGDNEINYYEGRQPAPGLIMHCSYNELRDVIQQKRQSVRASLGSEDKTVVIINPGPGASYKNFMDILDEIQINDIQHYFVLGSR